MILLLACTGPAPADSRASVVDSTAWSRPDREAPQPQLDAAAVGALAQELMAYGTPTPLPVASLYTGLFAAREPNCPKGAGYDLPGAFEGCNTSTGWHYAGVSRYVEKSGPDRHTVTLAGDGYITDPEGNRMVAAGEVSYDAVREGELETWTAVVSGTWGYPLAELPWLAEVPSTSLSIAGSRQGEALELSLIGGVSNSAGGLFYELAWTDACPEPLGNLRIREPGGAGWYRLDLEECGGCGALSFADGVSVGELCLPLDGLASALTAELALP